MTKTPIVAAVLALGLPLVAAAAPAVMGHGQRAAIPAASPDGTCYSNMGSDTFNAILSQNFEATFAAYSSQAADDFVLTSTCRAKSVDIVGQYFNGSGPADSVDLTVYKNQDNKPGKVLKTFHSRSYTNGASFHLKVAGTLKSGHYWLSPVANMAFGAGGEWGWEVQTEINGLEAMWQNPGGGFGICPTWATITNCIGVTGDFMFSINN